MINIFKGKRSKIALFGIMAVIFGVIAIQTPLAKKVYRKVIYTIGYNGSPITSIYERADFEKTEKTEFFINNELSEGKNLDYPDNDIKKILYSKDSKRLISYPDGYYTDFPLDVAFDFSNSPNYIKADNDKISIVVSKEWSQVDDVTEYTEYYLNRFLVSEQYQKENNITELLDTTKNFGKNTVRIISLKLNDTPEDINNIYTYGILQTSSRAFFRVMVKGYGDDYYNNAVEDILSSFRFFDAVGTHKQTISYQPKTPENWSQETKDFYNSIKNSNSVDFGIFSKDIYSTGINETIPDYEKRLDYKFKYILSYIHFGTEFPTEFMQKNYENGRIVELTYQTTTTNNEKLFGYTPNLDIYRGKLDEPIREFARKAKEFGHPFLFRLNNEMNSDWTSYSGMTNLCDPDIYIAIWQRFYNIFKEEGVNNAIWIYNPNDRNYPPCGWNNFLAYCPGDDYMQLIGVTGYNTGTYYADVMGETWREFDEIYDEVSITYNPFFKDYPWIITEFSSSSVGGDKAAWIENMFNDFYKYPNIKIAVWFDYADFDFRPEYKGQVSRPYYFDETPEVFDAFKKGLKTLK